MWYSRLLSKFLFLLMIPSLIIYPQAGISAAIIQSHPVAPEPQAAEVQAQNDPIFSYDHVLNLIEKLEDGDLEKNCTPQELESINHFFASLAREGMLPNDIDAEFTLEDDIEELLHGDGASYDSLFSIDYGGKYVLVPAVFYGQGEIVLCKSWFKKKWEQTKKFVKKHKKAIIIGAAVIVAAAVVISAVAVASTAGAAAGAVASSGSDKKEPSKSRSEEPSSISGMPSDASLVGMTAHETPILKAALDEQIFSFKKEISREHFFGLSNPSIEQQGLAWEEDGRILGSLVGHHSFNYLYSLLSNHPKLFEEVKNIEWQSDFPLAKAIGDSPLDFGHQEIDRKFSTDYASLYANVNFDVDFKSLSYQARGEKALAYGYLNQAVHDLGKAIELDPSTPL
ncbi:MAG: hypothetical protein ACM3JI_02780, partial [Anaerolineae bacterium]